MVTTPQKVAWERGLEMAVQVGVPVCNLTVALVLVEVTARTEKTAFLRPAGLQDGPEELGRVQLRENLTNPAESCTLEVAAAAVIWQRTRQ